MHAKPKPSRPAREWRPAATGDFEWEELPSLVDRVVVPADPAQRPPAVVWADTLPMALTPLEALDPEVVPGLVAREVTEPEIHRLFFGRDLLVNPLAQREAAGRRLGMLALEPEGDVVL